MIQPNFIRRIIEELYDVWLQEKVIELSPE
jgi:hypothetical protein